jgi:tricorn protease-like protein
MSQQGYLRHPTLHRDTIVFVCDDDLWSVATSGGHRAPADRGALGALDAVPFRGWQMDRVRRP